MKRLFVLVISLIMIISVFAACKNSQTAGADPKDTPRTEAAEDTPSELPEETPGEAQTAEPTEPAQFSGDVFEGNFKELKPDIPVLVDLDGDGADDKVLVTKTVIGAYLTYYTSVTITLASEPDEPFVNKIDHCTEFSAAVADFDPDDGRREIILCCDRESNDYETFVFRVNAEGAAVDTFEAGMYFGTWDSFYDGFPDDFTFDPEEGLPCEKRTEILGTFYVEGRFTVTAEGIKDITDMYVYYPEQQNGLTLEKELKLTLLNDDLSEADEITLPVGTVVFRRYTDRESWVIVETEDGKLCKAGVRIVDSGDEWGIYINDIRQDELGNIPYAD